MCGRADASNRQYLFRTYKKSLAREQSGAEARSWEHVPSPLLGAMLPAFSREAAGRTAWRAGVRRPDEAGHATRATRRPPPARPCRFLSLLAPSLVSPAARYRLLHSLASFTLPVRRLLRARTKQRLPTTPPPLHDGPAACHRSAIHPAGTLPSHAHASPPGPPSRPPPHHVGRGGAPPCGAYMLYGGTGRGGWPVTGGCIIIIPAPPGGAIAPIGIPGGGGAP